MEVRQEFENLCEQYLLGELPETDRQQLEEAYFSEDSLFERFLAVKDDLIDAYARGELTDKKRRQFEEHFLSSTPRRKQVEETREFIQLVSTPATTLKAPRQSEAEKSSRVSSWGSLIGSFWVQPLGVRVALVAVLLGVIAGAFFVLKQLQDRAERQLPEQEARQTTPPPNTNTPNANASLGPTPNNGSATSSPGPTPRIGPSPRSSSAQIASLVLLPVSSRDVGTSNSLTLGPDTRVVRLSLVFSGASQDRFEVSVRTVDGQQVFRRSNLKATSNADGTNVTVTFDSSLLTRQDYIATLRARSENGKLETIGDYYFRIERVSKSSASPPKE